MPTKKRDEYDAETRAALDELKELTTNALKAFDSFKARPHEAVEPELLAELKELNKDLGKKIKSITTKLKERREGDATVK